MVGAMRKLPLLLVLLLLSFCLLAAAASAQALILPAASQAHGLFASDEEEEAADDESEGEAGEEDEGEGEGEDCDDEDELCEEKALEAEEAEECLLESGSASVRAVPGAAEVRLTIHYRALEPAAVDVEARLRGGKGSLHLGGDRARFRRSGVYRENFGLGPRQMAKVLAARDFEVYLHAVGTPADCGLHLASRGPRRAR